MIPLLLPPFEAFLSLLREFSMGYVFLGDQNKLFSDSVDFSRIFSPFSYSILRNADVLFDSAAAGHAVKAMARAGDWIAVRDLFEAILEVTQPSMQLKVSSKQPSPTHHEFRLVMLPDEMLSLRRLWCTHGHFL